MRTETEHTILLKDYAPTPYRIDRVELDVKIAPDTSRVRALLTISPREGTAPGTALVLDGDELKLTSIALDGSPLPLTAYEVTPTTLTLVEPPARPFVLVQDEDLEEIAQTLADYLMEPFDEQSVG